MFGEAFCKPAQASITVIGTASPCTIFHASSRLGAAEASTLLRQDLWASTMRCDNMSLDAEDSLEGGQYEWHGIDNEAAELLALTVAMGQSPHLSRRVSQAPIYSRTRSKANFILGEVIVFRRALLTAGSCLETIVYSSCCEMVILTVQNFLTLHDLLVGLLRAYCYLLSPSV